VNYIEFISVHFGVPQIHAQGEAIVTYYPFNDYTKIHDPNNLLGAIDISLDPVKCKANSEKEKCVKFSLDHVFNEAPLHDIIRVTLVDKTRNHADVFFNDGIEVYGTSLNPPNTADIAAQDKGRGLVHLVQTDRAADLWSDQNDNTWTRNIMGSWIKLTQEEYTIPDDNVIGSNGMKRINQHFVQYAYEQEQYAMQVWDGTLIQSEIQGYIPGVTITETLRVDDLALQADMIRQIDRAKQKWDSQSIQGILDDYITTLNTSKEFGITDDAKLAENEKAKQLLYEMYGLE